MLSRKPPVWLTPCWPRLSACRTCPCSRNPPLGRRWLPCPRLSTYIPAPSATATSVTTAGYRDQSEATQLLDEQAHSQQSQHSQHSDMSAVSSHTTPTMQHPMAQASVPVTPAAGSEDSSQKAELRDTPDTTVSTTVSTPPGRRPLRRKGGSTRTSVRQRPTAPSRTSSSSPPGASPGPRIIAQQQQDQQQQQQQQLQQQQLQRPLPEGSHPMPAPGVFGVNNAPDMASLQSAFQSLSPEQRSELLDYMAQDDIGPTTLGERIVDPKSFPDTPHELAAAWDNIPLEERRLLAEMLAARSGARAAVEAGLDPGTPSSLTQESNPDTDAVREQLYPYAWQGLLQLLSPADAALVERLFGNEGLGYEIQSRRKMDAIIASLSQREKARLPVIMQQVEAAQQGFAAAEAERAAAARHAQLRLTRLGARLRARRAAQGLSPDGSSPEGAAAAAQDFADAIYIEEEGEEEEAAGRPLSWWEEELSRSSSSSSGGSSRDKAGAAAQRAPTPLDSFIASAFAKDFADVVGVDSMDPTAVSASTSFSTAASSASTDAARSSSGRAEPAGALFERRRSNERASTSAPVSSSTRSVSSSSSSSGFDSSSSIRSGGHSLGATVGGRAGDSDGTDSWAGMLASSSYDESNSGGSNRGSSSSGSLRPGRQRGGLFGKRNSSDSSSAKAGADADAARSNSNNSRNGNDDWISRMGACDGVRGGNQSGGGQSAAASSSSQGGHASGSLKEDVASMAASLMGDLPPSVAERLAKFVGTYERYATGSGWEVETRQDSRELAGLKRLYGELSLLASCTEDNLDAVGLTPAAFVRRLQTATAEVQDVVATGAARLQDPAARAIAAYMGSQMIVTDGDGQPLFQCYLEDVRKLGQFIVAAQTWEAYKAFMLMFQKLHPELIDLPSAVMAAGMTGGEEEFWWVLSPSSMSGEQVQAQQPLDSTRLRVDARKVAVIAELDPDNLRFLTELEAGGYSEDVLMKWYFHPVIGPRIRSGSFQSPTGISEFLQGVLEQAQKPMKGVDYM